MENNDVSTTPNLSKLHMMRIIQSITINGFKGDRRQIRQAARNLRNRNPNVTVNVNLSRNPMTSPTVGPLACCGMGSVPLRQGFEVVVNGTTTTSQTSTTTDTQTFVSGF